MKSIIITVISSLIISSLLIFGYHQLSKREIVFANTGTVLNHYTGKQIADTAFMQEAAKVQSNIEKLQLKYNQLNEAYQKASGAKKQELAYEIGVAEAEYNSYSTKSNEDLSIRQQELLANVLGEINAYIEQYGIQENYYMILGSTTDGSILYGKKGKNITEDLIEFINRQYEIDKELK